MKSSWIAQLQSPAGNLWMSEPWDGKGILVVGHPQKWMIQKGQAEFTARSLGETSSVGKAFAAPQVAIQSGWNHLAPKVKLRLVPLVVHAVPQFSEISSDFSASQAEKVEAEWIKRNSKIGASVLLALILILALWPKPKSEVPTDVIPAQLAKIILKKRPQTQTAATGGRGAVAPKNKTQLSQAMKSESFRKSVSQLLSSQGFKRLVSAPPGKLPSLQTGGTLSGASATAGNSTGAALPGVQVVGLGGGGSGGAVGYAKGGTTAIRGQGTGQVLLDLESSFVDEGLTRDEVGKVIHSHLSEVRYCYESSMVHRPEVEGRINISFTVGADGVVTTSSVHDSTVQDPRLDNCLLKRLNQWKFPKPKGGVTVAVTYPFIFKNLGR